MFCNFLPSLLVGLSSISLCSIGFAQTDKSQYTVFNPTPREKMRDLSTDRPDRTESPFTVDAGHFQIEAELVGQSQEKRDGVEAVSTAYAATNLKVGLTNNIDLQLVVVPHVEQKIKVAGISETESGVGDTTLRLKINVLGNDEGQVGIAFMPFVKIPTAKEELGNEEYEGGIIFPVGIALTEDWALGLMFQLDHNKNELNDKYHNDFISSITTSHPIAGDLGGYIEFYSEISAEDGAEWVATFDTGLTYGLSPDTQLDLGMNSGITRAAEDQSLFLGVSARI